MRSRYLAAVPLLATVGACLRGAAGCSAQESVISATDASFDVRPLDASDAGGIDRTAPPYDADPVPPPGLPEGWVLYRDYAAWCGLYVPADTKYLPAPIRWTACEGDAGAACQQMVEDWTSPDGTQLSPWVRGAVTPDGRAVLQISRFQDSFVYRLVAEADGPVRAAILETWSRVCTLGQGALASDRYVFTLFENRQSAGGGVAGRFDRLTPDFPLKFDKRMTHYFVVGTQGALDTPTTDTLDLYAWPDGRFIKTIWSSARDGLLQNYAHFSKDALFWQAGNIRTMKLKVYTDADGVKDFITFGQDFSRGAADLGTDDQVLVWAQGSGRIQPSGLFPVVDIMAAPYTTDPAALSPRRVRSDTSDGFTAAPIAVGCGYAARSGGLGIRLVRLADGVSWLLPGDTSQTFQWLQPLALTCNELFARVHIAMLPHGRENVARIRLDALGPGIPPD